MRFGSINEIKNFSGVYGLKFSAIICRKVKRFCFLPKFCLLAAFCFCQISLFANSKFLFSNVVCENAKAVLVLAPGMNTNGEFFTKETPWLDFAKKNNLGIIALNYQSNPEDLYETKTGYYWPQYGSGQALLDEVKRVYGKDLPLVLYGFSGGAHFVSRFIDWCPDRILAWCAYSAQFWDYPKSGAKLTNARGIVACGEKDGLRWQPTFGYYYSGRKDKRPWIWVSISNTGHNRSAKFEKFVREFFDEELAIWRGDKKPQKDIYCDISSFDLDVSIFNDQSEMYCPFRSENLAETWRKIQER